MTDGGVALDSAVRRLDLKVAKKPTTSICQLRTVKLPV
jgi:hypothetical protein